MGSNPSRTPVQPFETVDPFRNRRKRISSVAPSSNSDNSLTSASEETSTDARNREKSHWPLPPDSKDPPFQPNWSSDPQRYSVRRVYDTKKKVFDIDVNVTDVSTSEDFHQQETNQIRSEKDHSVDFDSAHIQSSMTTQSQWCTNLSTNEEIDQRTKEITSMQKKQDEFVQQENKTISERGQTIIQTIVDDTHRIQQDLLVYGKRRQTKQENLYNEYLQKYIAVLNEWKSKQLAHLQDEMDRYEEDIVNESRHRISHVNDEMNALREDILRSTIDKVSQVTKRIVEKIQSKSAHHLGTETVTKIQLTIHGNVGNKLSGQQFNFDRTS